MLRAGPLYPQPSTTEHRNFSRLSSVLIEQMHAPHRSWDEAYEQLQYERGACNLVQKYTPQLVRQRVLYSPQDTLAVVVRPETALAVSCCRHIGGHAYNLCLPGIWLPHLYSTGRDSLVILGSCNAISRGLWSGSGVRDGPAAWSVLRGSCGGLRDGSGQLG